MAWLGIGLRLGARAAVRLGLTVGGLAGAATPPPQPAAVWADDAAWDDSIFWSDDA